MVQILQLCEKGMSSVTARRRKRFQFSDLYSFKCGRQSFKEDHSQIGGPGFSRVVYCNEPIEADLSNYKNNYVSTTKYTLATFLPKSLFEQFRRVANFYFLVTGIMAFTPLAPYRASSAILPLIVVIGATMAKESVEDWRRRMQVCFTFLLLNVIFFFIVIVDFIVIV